MFTFICTLLPLKSSLFAVVSPRAAPLPTLPAAPTRLVKTQLIKIDYNQLKKKFD